MKNNTGMSKSLLKEALKNMPDDFTLSAARFHLSQALFEIEKVEGKRAKRENTQPSNFKMPQAKVANETRTNVAPFSHQANLGQKPTLNNVKSLLDIIDNMIDEEKKNLDNFKGNPAADQDFDDFDTLLG